MLPRIKEEIDLLIPQIEATYGKVEVSPSYNWLIVSGWKLPPGWNKTATDVLILIPGEYPSTPPDNLYTDPDLRLANGGMPGSISGTVGHANRNWLQFSYHVETSEWRPHKEPLKGHNLMTYLAGMNQRLQEAS